MKNLALTIAIFLTMSLPALAQSQSMVFPQFADGKFSNGLYYRSTLIITPRLSTEAPSCTAQLYGMTAMLGAITLGSLTINIPFSGFYATATPGTQDFQGGYATLNCNIPVFGLVLYSFYNANNDKISEATVFPSNEGTSFRMVADYRGGSRLGIAIANNTDAAHNYTISVGSTSATITIPPRRSLAKFLDELISFSNNELALVSVTSADSSSFSVIGLRFTGLAFTTIPAN